MDSRRNSGRLIRIAGARGWTGGSGLGKNSFRGGEPLLQGVLASLGCLVVVNGGEVVVNCVVNRGAWKTLFGTQIFSCFLQKS
jgi:hypothetical protein